MSSVNSTFSRGIGNGPQPKHSVNGICEASANRNSRDAYLRTLEVWRYPITSRNAMMGYVMPPKLYSTSVASHGMRGPMTWATWFAVMPTMAAIFRTNDVMCELRCDMGIF